MRTLLSILVLLCLSCRPVAMPPVSKPSVVSHRFGANVGPGVQVVALPVPSSGTGTVVNVYGKAILGYHLNGLPGATAISILCSDESVVINAPVLFDACVADTSNNTTLTASGWFIPLVQRASYVQVQAVAGNPSAATLTVSLADF